MLNWDFSPSIVIQFCTQCGNPVTFEVPPGDNLPRHVCPSCRHIHYENPRLVVGCVPTWAGQILLCRRAIEPRMGFWTLPAGFMENGESTAEAARRETHEEAGAQVEVTELFAMVSIPHINQVHLFYRAEMDSPDFSAGTESLEVALYRPGDIPWNDLSFRSVRFCLERFIADQARGTYRLHEHTLAPAAHY